MFSGGLELDGDSYISSEFGFSQGNIGRNYGILLVFVIGLLLINMLLVEKVDWAKSGGALLEFAGKRKLPSSPQKRDEESLDNGRADRGISQESSGKTASDHMPAPSGSTFTWRNINYTVPYQKSHKQLLTDVSGYCEPGKLTALVGASGAGKSVCKSFFQQLPPSKSPI